MTRFCFLALTAVLLVTGCGTTQVETPIVDSEGPKTESILRSGDLISVRIDAGSAAQRLSEPPVETVIDENGEISLPLIGRVQAAGSTPSELAERIQASYVPRYYVRCTATIVPTVRFFYVGGEVRQPGRYNWTEDVTLMKAINTAGGFTDYANRRKAEVARGKNRQTFDVEDIRQQPEKDFAIRPGDSIYVPRSIF